MKKSMILLGMLSIGYAYAQEGNVGINTSEPKATLDIVPETSNLAKNTNEGIIAPRLTKARIAGIADANLVEGTLVYATDNTYAGTNTKVSKITEKGYYFYNGTEWVKVQYKDTNDAEWVYDDTTKRINLKRSGVGDFKGKVFYEKNGGLKSVDFGINRNRVGGIDTFTYNSDGTFNYFEPYNTFIKQASNLNTNNTFNRYLDYRALVLDNAATNTGYFGLATSMVQKQGETTETGVITGIANDITLFNAGKTTAIRGIANNFSINNENMEIVGPLRGYTSEIGTSSSTKTTEMSGIFTDVTLRKNAKSDFVRGGAKYITFDGNTGNFNTVNVDQSYAVFKNNASPTIDHLYLYRGHYFNQAGSSMANIKNAYGLYLQGINFASENNYAIYTNQGNVYFGDKVGIGVLKPTQRLEVAGNILAQQGRLMSRANTNEGGALELINDKKTEANDVAKWIIYNMSSTYLGGLHFWAYGADGTNKNSKMILTDEGRLAIGFGEFRPEQMNLTETLEVHGNAKISGLKGTGTRNVVADENGVLRVGEATTTGATTLTGDTGLVCNAENRGKMNFIQGADGKSDVFGICMKNKDGNYYWGYMVGGNNPTNGTGAFGSGL